jgi:2-amino-4-hydroxy-6-hydroxymethyldihydropteridine diphosphokinase
VHATGPDFINAVLAIKTGLSAYDLLAHLQQIELACGRERPYRNAPRTLDLDLLLFGTARIHSPSLQVPHPRMVDRAFVLRPLSEIASELVSATQLQAVADQPISRLPPD